MTWSQRDKSPYVDRLSSGLEQFVAQLAGGLSPFEPAADALLTGGLHQQTFAAQASQLRAGRVQFGLPYFNWYRVALDDGGAVIGCTAGTQGAQGLVGAKLHAAYPPDTPVWVLLHPTGLWGYILATIPALTDDGNISFGDWITQGSGVGLRRLAYYREWINRLADEGGVRDFSRHNPQDQLATDYSLLTELGGGLHLDPCQVFLRIDESCGLFAYYFDRLLRIAGQNLDILSMVHQEQYRHDEGELSYFRGECLYPWEFLGVFQPADLARSYRETSDVDVHFQQPYGKLEPAQDDQTAFHRYEEYGGYLGQLRLRQVLLPPPAVWEDGQALYRFSSAGAPPAVFRESLGPDGSYTLASAKRLVLAKRLLMPAPRRRQPAESYRADADRAENENYAFSGHQDGGATHRVGDPQRPADHAALAAASNLLDLHAHLFNWQALHPFHYHEGDFTLPEDTASRAPLPLDELTEGMWMTPPAATPQRVDNRYGDVDYYPLYSHLTLNDDGSVVLQGGLGEELRMAGGNIVLACPGMILLQSGKSTVVLAGDDAIVRARHAVDVTSAQRDVRVKAEKNLLLLSGNGGTGGTLLENRAVGTDQDYPTAGGEQIVASGIVLKAPTSAAAVMAGSIYLRTGSEAGGIQSGEIVLDAASGNQNVRAICFDFTRHIRNRAEDAFGLPEVTSVNVSSAQQTLLGGRLDVVDSIRSNSFFVCRGQITSTDGHIASRTGGPVGRLQDAGQARAQLIQGIAVPADALIPVLQADYQAQVVTELYGEEKLGHPDVQQRLSFGCRTEAEYGTEQFLLPQAAWQIHASGSGAVDVWHEPVVAYQGAGQATMPWPGVAKWRDEETLLTLPPEAFTLYDVAAGIPQPRGAVYEAGQLGGFQPATPQTAYTVLHTP